MTSSNQENGFVERRLNLTPGGRAGVACGGRDRSAPMRATKSGLTSGLPRLGKGSSRIWKRSGLHKGQQCAGVRVHPQADQGRTPDCMRRTIALTRSGGRGMWAWPALYIPTSRER